MEESKFIGDITWAGNSNGCCFFLPLHIAHYDLSLWNNSVIPVFAHFTCRWRSTQQFLLETNALTSAESHTENTGVPGKVLSSATITPISHSVLYPSWLPASRAIGVIRSFECFKYYVWSLWLQNPALPFPSHIHIHEQVTQTKSCFISWYVKMETSCTLCKWVSWCPGFGVCIIQVSPEKQNWQMCKYLPLGYMSGSGEIIELFLSYIYMGFSYIHIYEILSWPKSSFGFFHYLI